MRKNTKKENAQISQNEIVVTGTVDNIFYQSEKATKFTLRITNGLPNEKSFSFTIGCRWFGKPYELEEGESIKVEGKLSLDSYESKEGKKIYNNCIDVSNIS